MRKLFLPITTISLFAAVFFAYKYYSLAKTLPIVNTIDKSKCAPCMEYNNVKQSSTLDLNLIRAMTRNYQLGANGLGKTKSVWLSLEKLQQFIYEIQSKTCDCSANSKLGARFYFGDYPDDLDWQNPAGFKDDLNNPSANEGDFRARVAVNGINPYAKITSIIIVPTIFDGNNNVDFDPADNPNGCKGGYNTRKFIERAGSVEKFNNASVYLHNKLGISITALSATNHGDACPPPPPSGGGCPANGSYVEFDH